MSIRDLFCGPPYEPDIIDLRRYEADLLYQQRHGLTLMPPRPTPGRIGPEWTVAEVEAMRANRAVAEGIYAALARPREKPH